MLDKMLQQYHKERSAAMTPTLAFWWKQKILKVVKRYFSASIESKSFLGYFRLLVHLKAKMIQKFSGYCFKANSGRLGENNR